MANKNFGVKQINLIGASGTPTIESPANLNLNATIVAISTDVTIGGQVQSNLKIGSSYSVGIGTTNPTSKLHVVGNVLITGVSTTSSLNVGTGGTIITTTTAGLVGIGTTNPGAVLHVVPTSNSIVGLFSGDTEKDIVRITQLGIGNALVVETNPNPDSTPFVVNQLGNVGIGTNTVALFKLQVHDSFVHITNSTEGSGVTKGLLLGYESSADTQLINAQSKSLTLNTAFNTQSVILQSTGVNRRVGIGTTNPTSKLHVVGNVLITGVSTTSSLNVGTGGTIITTTTAGLVGIGTTNPISKLHVQGDANISGILTARKVASGIISNSKVSAYILEKSDVGKYISISSGGVTVPSGIFSEGDVISIYNNSASNQTITQGTSVTMYFSGNSTTGNRTLSQRGLSTILCVENNTFIIGGAGLL